MSQVALGFIPEPMTVPFEKLLPSRKLPDNVTTSRKYKQILESLRSVGLIEPLSISPTSGDGTHVLLDGHTRILAMKELGLGECLCLISTDDETYTYNNRVNRLSTVQEHLMVKRAINRGVSPEKLAKSLNVDLGHIMRKVKLLDGICAEAVALLKDQQFAADLGTILKRMKPMRQVECVELMVDANCVTLAYANALYAATPTNQLVDAVVAKKVTGVSPTQMANMEREMSSLQEQYKLAEQTFSQDVFNLLLASKLLAKWLENAEIERYLQQHYPEILTEFKFIVECESLDA